MSAATILEVARKAGVSAGTVSRVLNGHPAVSAENQERVRRAITALDYAPRQRKASMTDVNPLEHKTLLLLMLGMQRSLATLPVIAAAMDGVEQAAGLARANLLVANVPAADHVPDVLLRQRIDGVILKGALQGNLAAHAHPGLIKRLKDLPTVWVLGRPEGCWGDVVRVNDVLVGQLAAEYLTGRGHKQLAFVSAKPSHSSLMRRQAGFTFFAERLGASVRAYLGQDEVWRFPSPAVDDVALVQDLVDRVLREKLRPTAVFAPDDSVGAMAARALAARGLQAGRDISLMACNNERPLLMGVYPALTTLDVHAHEIGALAVDQLAWRIAHPDRPCVELAVEPTLVEGESVARL
ncbi:MAG: LacI family DNA-binding transcriptional regulator [Isosphaeraceae bacterium]|nr:LacI family DNA-binding transcriptional regulator [Isosphaeraceae bacterium]